MVLKNMRNGSEKKTGNDSEKISEKVPKKISEMVPKKISEMVTKNIRNGSEKICTLPKSRRDLHFCAVGLPFCL